MLQGSGESIYLYEELPEPIKITSNGKEYAAFTAEQYAKILVIYSNYISLGDFTLAAISEIEELKLQTAEYKRQISDYEIANELLRSRVEEYKTLNLTLENQLTKNKRQSFLKSLGVSALVGLGTGLIGVAVGYSVK
jgi:phage regulator Rha-like protein